MGGVVYCWNGFGCRPLVCLQEYGFVPGYKPEAPPPPPAIATKPTSDTGKDATAPGAAAPGPGAANGQKAVGPDSNGQAAMVIDSGLAISAP